MAKTAANALSAATGYAAANVLTEHLQTAWRSVGTGGTYVSVNLGSARTPQALLFEDCNFTSATAKGHTSADVRGGTGQGITISQNIHTGRYSALWVVSGASNKQYWGLDIGAQSPVDGAGYFRVGRISVIKTLRTIDKNWGYPYGPEVAARGDHVFLPGGMTLSTDAEDPYVLLDLSGRVNHKIGDTNSDGRSAVQDIAAILRARGDERVLHYENRGDTSHAYLCLCAGGSMRESSATMTEASTVLREVV